MDPHCYTISAFTENSPGVLHRLTVLFTKRKINIESLTVSETGVKGISRFTIVIRVERGLAEKIAKQIRRIIEVRDVFVSENSDLIFKEIAFYQVACHSPEKRKEVEELAHRYGSSVIFVDSSSLVIEKTGSEDEVDSLFLLLEPFGISEFARSGRIAILKKESHSYGTIPSGK